MTNETITIYYKPIPGFDGTIYHETAVYTNSSGQSFYSDEVDTIRNDTISASIFTKIFNAIGDAEDVAFNGGASQTSLWGTLAAEVNVPFDPNNVTVNTPTNPTGAIGITRDNDALHTPYQSDIIAVGPDLSSQWAAINTSLSAIGSENLEYSPFNQNSNDSMNNALIAAGLTPPSASILTSHWAPALGSNELVNVSTDPSNDIVVQIQAEDGSGNIDKEFDYTAAADGSSVTRKITGYSSPGTVQYTENTTYHSNGNITVSISGSGDVCDADDATISITSAGQDTFTGSGNTITDSTGTGITFILGTNDGSDTIKGLSPLFLRNDTVKFADTSINGGNISVSGNVLTYAGSSTVTLAGIYGSTAHLKFANGSAVDHLWTVQTWISHIVNDANATQADTVVLGHGSGNDYIINGGTASMQCKFPANDNAVLLFNLAYHRPFAA